MHKPTNTLLRSTAFLTAGCWVVFVIGYMLFPGFTPGNLAGLAVISATAIFGILLTPLASRRAATVMAGTALLLGVGVILNTWLFTTFAGGTADAPVLVNYDEARWWEGALWAAGDASVGEPPMHLFFCDIMGFFLRVFGPTVGVPLIVNVALALGALILCGMLTMKLTQNRGTALIAIISTAAVCYWLAACTLLLKEPMIIFAIALAAYGLISTRRTMAVCLSVAALMLAAARPNYIFVLIAGIAFVPGLKVQPTVRFCSAVLAVGLWYVADSLLYNADVQAILTSNLDSTFSLETPDRMAYFNIIGDYSAAPWYTKLLLLPITAVTQYLIPFPWNFMRDVPFGATELWAHISYPWYAFGAVFVYGLFARLRHESPVTLRLVLWGLGIWLLPCYLFGGSVSRYGLPAVIIVAPLVASTLKHEYKKRPFYIYSALFTVILLIGLLICHHLQTCYSQ